MLLLNSVLGTKPYLYENMILSKDKLREVLANKTLLKNIKDSFGIERELPNDISTLISFLDGYFSHFNLEISSDAAGALLTHKSRSEIFQTRPFGFLDIDIWKPLNSLCKRCKISGHFTENCDRLRDNIGNYLPPKKEIVKIDYQSDLEIVDVPRKSDCEKEDDPLGVGTATLEGFLSYDEFDEELDNLYAYSSYKFNGCGIDAD
jgi:hypothetical protein